VKLRLTIGVDIDGVLGDVVTPTLKRINRAYGLTLKYSDITIWNIAVANTRIDVEIENALRNPAIALALKCYPNAEKVMAELYRKYRVVIVTSRIVEAEKSTHKWLKLHFKVHDYLSTRKTGKSHLPVDVLIDDFTPNIKGFAENGGFGILFDQPWNREDGELEALIKRGKVFRCTDWNEIANAVETIAEKRRQKLV
jgi:5'(3')-deoxyribonucleotidase